jgi:peptide/nickel transport system permease protein
VSVPADERAPALVRAWEGMTTGTRVATIVLVSLGVLALIAPIIAPYALSHQIDIVAMKSRPPSLAHPFGTDRFSRDVLSRVLFGLRVTLSVATLAVLVSAVIGTLYGLVAAMSNRVVDTVMMRALDALLAIPRVLLLIAVVALWDPLPLLALIGLLGVTGWFDVSRLVRAEALSVREREFVVAARALGAGGGRILRRHVLPSVLTPVIVTTTLGMAQVVVLEAGLSFLGIGAREPVPSLGTMLQDGTEAFAGTWWVALFPGITIVAIVLCINVVGDALRASLDPRQLPSVRLGTRTAALPTAPLVHD